MGTEIKVSSESIGQGVIVFSIGGNLDSSVVNIVNEKISQALEGDCVKMIFDLSELEYISSAGLRILLYAAKGMKAKNGVVVLCSVNDNVQKVLDMSGTTRFLSFCEDRAAALAAT